MRIRSIITATALTGLLAAGILRCKLPPEPAGPTALSTHAGFVHTAFVNVPAGGVVDRQALVASLKEFDINTIIIRTAADETGAFVDDRVSLAIDLQRDLDATVLIGTYLSPTRNGKPIEQLLQPDPTFKSCYPKGPALDASSMLIDKLRICSQDVSTKIVTALKALNASNRIGCYIAQETELVDTLTDDGKAKLTALFHDSASACVEAGRLVGISPILSARSGDPDRAGIVLRESLQDSGVDLVTLHDGVGAIEPADPTRATPYYQGLRNALADREPIVAVFANVEAFECATPDCAKTRPTSTNRYLLQLCGARARVDGIATFEYLHDLAEKPLFTSALDASAELQELANDSDAAAQLRTGYLQWRDSGAPCPPK